MVEHPAPNRNVGGSNPSSPEYKPESNSMKFIGKIKTFFTDVYNELKRVTFPGKKELWIHTVITIVMIIVIAIIIGLFDLLLSEIVKFIL